MARRLEDVEQDWQPTPEQRAEYAAAVAAYERGDDKGMPLEELEPLLEAWIAEAWEDGQP